MMIDGWRHIGTDTNTVTPGIAHPFSALLLTGGDDIIVRNFNLYGNFAQSAITCTTTGVTRINIYGDKGMSRICTENATDSCIALELASTGWIGPYIMGMVQDNEANLTEIFAGAAIQFGNPLPVCNLAGEQTATTTNITLSTD
jgi:hypothetical protein